MVAATLALAFVAAHALTPQLVVLGDLAVALGSAFAPSLILHVRPDDGMLRPLAELAWMLLIVTPPTVLSLQSFKAWHGTNSPGWILLGAEVLAVGSGLGAAALVIWGFRLQEWSRLFLLAFGIFATGGLVVFRRIVAMLQQPASVTALAATGPEFSALDARLAESYGGLSSSVPVVHGQDEAAKSAHDGHICDILERVARDGAHVTQRSLAHELGIALGLTNFLLKKAVDRGLVTVTRLRSNRLRYEITPAGLAERARLYRQRLASNVWFYIETRARIEQLLDSLAADAASKKPGEEREERVGRLMRWWSFASPTLARHAARQLRIVLYGTGAVAEIGLLLLDRDRFEIVGVVNEPSGGMFHGRPVNGLDALHGLSLHGEPFDYVVALTLESADEIRRMLASRQIPLHAVRAIA